jgi:cyclopropane-fatty-acyl-phospholipid synthase
MTTRLHHPLALARKLRRGSAGLAESYVDGDWDTDDLVAALRRLARVLAPAQRVLDAVVPRFGRRGRSPGGGSDGVRDRRQIRAHYDVSDDFFALVLDPTMAYSCAVFDRPGQSLEEAQLAKFERILAPLDLGPDDHLLEIGTGWGGLAEHAAATTGCRVTTTTVSANQHASASARVAAAGLADRVTVIDTDWRALQGAYDGIVSVEMVEAVHWTELDAFLVACRRLVRPGGRAAIQAIVIDDRAYDRYKRSDDEFIRTMVFPGGCLPSVGALRRAAEGAGFAVETVDDLTTCYPETLARWQANLDAHESAVRALGFDDSFLRLWRFYLSYCQAGFLERRVGLIHLSFASAAPAAAAPASTAGAASMGAMQPRGRPGPADRTLPLHDDLVATGRGERSA